MCATLVARRSWPARSTVVAGVAAGATGAALFIVIHSLLIVPIWTRFLGHLPFALAAGLALALAFDEYVGPTSDGGGRPNSKGDVAPNPDGPTVLAHARTVLRGSRFGLITFATLAPATAFSNTLRVTGAAGGANGLFGTVGTLALAVASGGVAGWLVARRRRAVVAFAASTLALTIAMGGTIPIVNSARAMVLFVGFLPICIGTGVALSVARRCLTTPEHP